VEDGEIAAAVMKDSPEEAVQGLVAVANQRGASDNVTVGVFSTGNGRVREVLLPASPEAIRAEAARVRSSRPIRVAGWAALAVALVLIGTLLWLRGVPQVKVAPAVSAPPPESSASMPSDPEKGSR
jgi:predicted anti-sigma-YlaC factor YlaD